ncbi:YDG domain-containing protein, partial [Poseidonibacter sp.]|uniref:YDG domain-containing protein n=1 Tax=Poseidonibacter sp. TaxID=2321188 RepID=UPI003C76828E
GKTVTVSSLVAGGTDGGNYNITNATATTTANITKKDITVSGIVAADKTYDGTTNASLTNSGTLNGLVGEDNVTFTGNAYFSDKNAGTAKTVTVTSLVAGGIDGGNYNITNTTATTSADITKKYLSVSGITVENKIYDGTTSATTTGTGILNGLVGEDTVNLSSSTAYFNNKNVGENKTVNLSYLINGTDSGNYTTQLEGPITTSADITKKDITVTASASNKVYDGNTLASETLSTTGLIGEDSVSFTGNAYFTDKNAGTNKTVNVSGFQIFGEDAGNYNITNQNATTTANITKKDITVSEIDVNDKTYDGTTSASLTNSGTLNGLVGEDNVGFSTVANFTDKNVAENKTVNLTYTLSGEDSQNYSVINGEDTANIDKRVIYISGITVNDKIYDGTTDGVTAGQAILDNKVQGDKVTVIGASAEFIDKNVGENKVVYLSYQIDGEDSNNYSIWNNNVDNEIASISKADATVTANSDTKTYNGLSQSVNGFTASGLVNGETISVLDGVSANVSGLNAGTYTAKAAGTDDNYNLTFVDGSLKITPKEITVSADDLSKIYGETDKDLTYTANGLVGSDTLSGLITRVSGENTGTYTILQGLLANSNYDITFENGTYTITPKVEIPEVIVPVVQPQPEVNTKVALVSKPLENEATKKITMSEIRATQTTQTTTQDSETSNNETPAVQDVRVPLSQDSIV